MTKIRVIRERMIFVIASAIAYFIFDYFVYKTSFIQSYSFVGLKSFLPAVLGLNFGPYGIIGELIAVTIKRALTNQTFEFYLMECIIIVVMGLGTWFLWHVQSRSHMIRFRYIHNYIMYILIIVFASLICASIGKRLINDIAYHDILVWNITMSILVGIPIEIIYGSLMNLDPVLPPLYMNGKRIAIEDDIVYALDAKPDSISALNEKVEELLLKEKVDMKRMFEIQNVIEELYLRIIKKYPDTVIDVKARYDITFSVEYLYIEKRYNPFRLYKGEDMLDIAGLNIIKHRALLANYSFNYGLNKVHIVI